MSTRIAPWMVALGLALAPATAAASGFETLPPWAQDMIEGILAPDSAAPAATLPPQTVAPRTEEPEPAAPPPTPTPVIAPPADDVTAIGLAAVRRVLGDALERGQAGDSFAWEDPASGAHGVIVPEFDYDGEGGLICRDYRRTLVHGETRAAFEGSACRFGPGDWVGQGERLLDEPAALATTTDEEDREQLVLEVQTLLTALGYDVGRVDGALGPRTNAAIRSFREERGLQAEGDPDRVLLRHLRAAKIQRTATDPENFPPFAISTPAPPRDPG